MRADDSAHVYLNEQLLVTGGDITSNFDVTSLVQPGQNFLYVENENGGFQGGVAFSAGLNFVPEPAGFGLAGFAALCASAIVRSRKTPERMALTTRGLGLPKD